MSVRAGDAAEATDQSSDATPQALHASAALAAAEERRRGSATAGDPDANPAGTTQKHPWPGLAADENQPEPAEELEQAVSAVVTAVRAHPAGLPGPASLTTAGAAPEQLRPAKGQGRAPPEGLQARLGAAPPDTATGAGHQAPDVRRAAGVGAQASASAAANGAVDVTAPQHGSVHHPAGRAAATSAAPDGNGCPAVALQPVSPVTASAGDGVAPGGVHAAGAAQLRPSSLTSACL